MSRAEPHWVEGRVVDGTPAARARSIVAVLALVLLFDLLLGLRLGAAPRQPDAIEPDELGTSAGLRAQLQAAVDDPRRSILLIGDSVLAGDVMAGRVAGWQQQRVVDHLRRALPDALAPAVGIHQIALDGLLPIDMLHLVSELDRLDPEGRVELVIELNVRYFSGTYAHLRRCSRPALCELGRDVHVGPSPTAERVPLRDVDPVRTLEAAWQVASEAALLGRDELLARLPVFRRRGAMPSVPPALERVEGLLVASPDARARTPSPIDRGAAAEAEVRVREHYRSARLSDRNAQARALELVLQRLAARERRSLLFVTPLADDFEVRTLHDQRMGEIQAELARRVADRGSDALTLVSLDHPLFVDHLFLDHCHLGPEGNRILALNLAYELGLPLAELPAHAELVHLEDPDRSLVHRAAKGFEQGPAWLAAFRNPEGVTASADARRVVVADTGNHVLRQLRGRLEFVEVLVGDRKQAGIRDGARDEALLQAPREPVLIDTRGRDDDPVYFLDGEQGELVRVVERGHVATLALEGPGCAARRLRRGRAGELWLACRDGRVLALALATLRTRELLPAAAARREQAIAATPRGELLVSDASGRIHLHELDAAGRAGPGRELFANLGSEPLPQGEGRSYPFAFDEVRLTKIVDMQWIDRYGMLLVADEQALGRAGGHERLERDISERIMLRVLDFEAELVWPWLKPTPHGEAHALWNAPAEMIVTYFHRGSFTLLQGEAGLLWLESGRSRLIRLADGLLGFAKFGSTQSRWARVELYDTIGSAGPAEALRRFRPDRWLERRHEPLARRGPYLALFVGSPLSSLSDRLGNYSLARRLELELQRELGIREGIRLDLFQRTRDAKAGLDAQVDLVETFVDEGPPPDVILFELSGKRDFVHEGQLERLAALAARSDALVVVFDASTLEADRRDAMRPSSRIVLELLDEARALGFVVLDPSAPLLRELLTDAPWSNPPWSTGMRHGAPWAIDHTARVLRTMLSPALREFLRARVPARVRAPDREPEGAEP